MIPMVYRWLVWQGYLLPGVERARDLLLFLESQAQGARAGEGGVPLQREAGQSSLFGWSRSPPTRIVEKDLKWRIVCPKSTQTCSVHEMRWI
ncbi:MAG: hypothetical protein Ct9H90mP16_01510 [Candidatus Poseidoniales archaeon]|nr:MAG: hypothetical protein Ct9H90mP16_01510 [Candidatus Poseidoniales archaeon]